MSIDMKPITTLEEYISVQSPEAQQWLKEFFGYMDKKYPHLKITMFRQCPMYKRTNNYLDGYVMFTASKTHFTLHILNFDLIESAKARLDYADFGKGCIKVKYKYREAWPILKELCDFEIARW